MKHAPTIVKELDKRISEYEMFAYELTARVAILELRSLKEFILKKNEA